jgi:hypothetical protein
LCGGRAAELSAPRGKAHRIARLAPGALIRVEVIGILPKAFAGEPKIGDLLP